ASLTAKGTVQLSSAINSTSEILAATPKAVKAAYDLANGKQPADATLTALAGLVTAADRLPYFTGADRAALATLTAIGRAIIAKGSIKDVLNYLGLGEGSPAIGVPFFWPSAAMPDTVIKSWSSMVFLKFNGAKFSASDYPVLAKVFPSLVLPEARGDFIRIWDDGRGADGGRKLLSWQAATNFSQFAGNIGGGAGHAINFHDGIAGNQPGFSRFNFTSNSLGDGVNFVAVRPRNIAFNFLVRAK
ncbi:phage tail protein, partial [Escherichia coli]